MSTPKFEIFDDGARKGEKLVIDRHLNYEFRYQLTNMYVTGERAIWFYPVQYSPWKHKCGDGDCDESLCNLAEDEFTHDVFEWEAHYDDPAPFKRKGEKVLMTEDRVVSFVPVKKEEQASIDMNWKRLRMMAQPIVDEQLGKLAMDQSWRTTPMKLSLGSLVVDTSVVRIDEASYNEMHPFGSATDMDAIEKVWKEKSTLYKAKRESEAAEKEKDGKKKAKLTMNGYDYGSNSTNTKNTGGDTGSDDEDVAEKENRVNGAREEEKQEEETKKAAEKRLVEEEVTKECKECCEEPCVWIAQRDAMIDFDDDEHSHLPEGAGPPNNIRRKKVYRQMVLTMNEGGTGKGVRVALPKCVEDGVRELFPSPTFMGFKCK
jgi:hypothetical protein